MSELRKIAGGEENELVAQFVRELEKVRGRVLYAESEAAAAEKITAIAREAHVRSAAVGNGVTCDLGLVAGALERAGIVVMRTARVAEAERLKLRERIARCDLGVAEADYAVAASGTLAVASDANRPGSLTLLPPLSVIVIRVERIVPNLATLMAHLGAADIAANRVTLITGPSRTADIEKRIVLGVHGPRELYAVLVGKR